MKKIALASLLLMSTIIIYVLVEVYRGYTVRQKIMIMAERHSDLDSLVDLLGEPHELYTYLSISNKSEMLDFFQVDNPSDGCQYYYWGMEGLPYYFVLAVVCEKRKIDNVYIRVN